MTKKDFILIAQAIREINARKARGARITEIFADHLSESNPQFNKERFITYVNNL